MRALAAVAVLTLVALACGGPPPAPEVVTRAIPPNPAVDPLVGDASVPDFSDAGTAELDAGCCVVAFALAALDGEVAAVLQFRSATHAMELDGGVWRVSACVEPAPNVYSYQTAWSAADDAGLVWLDRVNDAVPTSSGSSAANVFDAPANATCATLDASVHGEVPDAG